MANQIDITRGDPIRIARSLRQRAHLPVKTMEEAQSLLAECETLRRPVAKDWLMGRVATLLSHFYVSLTDETEMRAILADWAKALAEFPQWAVTEACDEYLRTQERKPTIAAIRKLCEQHFHVVEFTRQKAMRGPVAESQEEPRKPMTCAQREAVDKAMRDWLANSRAQLTERGLTP